MAQDELKKIQDRLQEPLLSVIYDSPTRWNSTLHMLERMQKLKESLCLYAATHSKVEKVSNREWMLLSKYVKALKPYEEVTKELSSCSSSISDVIPFIVSLKKTLQTNVSEAPIMQAESTGSCSEPEETDDQCSDKDEEETTKVINVMKRTIRADLDKRFGGLDIMNIYRIATYLDPKYKGKLFSSIITEQVKAAFVALHDETIPAKKTLKVSQPTSLTITPTPSTSASESEAFSLLLTSSSSDESDEPVHTEISLEVKKYHQEKRINGKSEDTLK